MNQTLSQEQTYAKLHSPDGKVALSHRSVPLEASCQGLLTSPHIFHRLNCGSRSFEAASSSVSIASALSGRMDISSIIRA